MKELTLVFFIRNAQVLLAMKKRGFGVGRWNGVGGKVDIGETIKQAMIRESEEEVFMTPTDYEKTAEIIFHESIGDTNTSMLVHVYTCRDWEGEPKESDEMAPQWFEADELPYDAMWPDDPYWLPQVLTGKKLKAEFTLENNETIIASKVELIDSFGDSSD